MRSAATSVAEAKTRAWEEFGEAIEEKRPDGFEKVLVHHPASEDGKAMHCQHGV